LRSSNASATAMKTIPAQKQPSKNKARHAFTRRALRIR